MFGIKGCDVVAVVGFFAFFLFLGVPALCEGAFQKKDLMRKALTLLFKLAVTLYALHHLLTEIKFEGDAMVLPYLYTPIFCSILFTVWFMPYRWIRSVVFS